MNALAVVSFVLAVAAANAGLLPLHETGTLLKGPSARSTIVGADGLGVSTVFEGGVVAPTHDVAVATPEVVVARAEPIIAYAEPVIARHEPLIAPAWEHGRSDIIAGPSGTIIANKEHNIAPIVAARREIYAEPSVRTVLPVPVHRESLIIPATRSYTTSLIPRFDFNYRHLHPSHLHHW